MEFRYSESFDKPVEQDTKSSPNGVFIRKNITEEEYVSPESGETKTKYVYEEAFITFEEYAVLSATQYAVDNAEKKTQEEIIDAYTEELIENGTI